MPPFHGTHVTLYIEFKLLYKFSILITLVHWRDLNRRGEVSSVPRKKIKEENKNRQSLLKTNIIIIIIIGWLIEIVGAKT